MSETSPVENVNSGNHTAPRLAIAATYKDPETGALYVHHDLEMRQGPWDEEAHVPPMNVTERLGDVESWAAYVKRFGTFEDMDQAAPLMVWNRCGLRAVIDYACSDGQPGRCQWVAEHPFAFSFQWKAWMALANGQPMSQKTAVEKLEDLAEDIVEPSATDLALLLRTLRAAVRSDAESILRPDGGSSVHFKMDKTVDVEVPPSFTIAVPVLKGHLDSEGRPVLYRLAVRLRASVDDSAKLTFRLTIPAAERVLEDVYADRVRLAGQLLGESFQLLRAAD